jgi:5-formyltetrahydrofolate cyclo-ligase
MGMASPQRRPDDGIAARKAELRKRMIAARDALDPKQRARLSSALMEAVMALPRFKSARSVLATMVIGAEWNTGPLIRAARRDGKAIVLPRVARVAPQGITRGPSRLEIHRLDDPKDLVPGVWNIPEPDPARCPVVKLEDVDFALVPALAVDRNRYRLGYGAGYFDGLLRGRGSKPFCVTALPEAFVVDELPRHERDVPVDLVITA